MFLFHYLVSFIVILSLIVFIHEFGHYIVAKKFGVKIEEFAIGFGKELWGFNDKSGTRWKFCLIPLGGYVKMFGDQNAASAPDQQMKQKKLTKKEREGAFLFKPLYQRFLVVLAGPLANYLLAIVILFFLFCKFGISSSTSLVTEVLPDSPASEAGLIEGDMIAVIEGKKIKDFNDIQQIVQISANMPLDFTIERDGGFFDVTITPEEKSTKDFLGNEIKTGLLGIRSDKIVYREVGVVDAALLSVTEVVDMTVLSLKVVKQLILGQRSLSDLGGPVKIAKYSGQVTKKSLAKDEDGKRNLYLIFWFIAIISINLGFANLLPIPMLDGGHLFLYTIEAVRGKELSANVQELVFKVGFAFLLLIFAFVTISDIKFLLAG